MSKNKKNRKFNKFGNVRLAGKSHTLIAFPLHDSITEIDIETFCSKAAVSKPLRIDIFCPRISNNNNNNDSNNYDDSFNGYAFITFDNHDDCELIHRNLNKTQLNNKEINIKYARIPRYDLENQTNILELYSYPAIKTMKEVIQFFNEFKGDNNDRNIIPLISPIPHISHIRGKWKLKYSDKFMAKKSMEHYSARMFDGSFVILQYSLPRHYVNIDRRECFYGISDRIVLYGIKRGIQIQNIHEYFKNNGFEPTIIKDIQFVFENKRMAIKNIKKYQNHRETYKQKDGYIIITINDIKKAKNVYVALNGKSLTFNDKKCDITTGFYPGTRKHVVQWNLKGTTNWCFISNLPWNINQKKIREWINNCGISYKKNNDIKNNENTIIDEYNTDPISITIEYIGGYCEGRAHIELPTKNAASIVVETYNETKYNGRTIYVDFQIPSDGQRKKSKTKDVTKDEQKQTNNINENDNDIPTNNDDLSKNVYLNSFSENKTDIGTKRKNDDVKLEPPKKKLKI